MFPGQGAQHPSMCASLYGVEPEFTQVMEEGLAGLGPMGPRVRDAWLQGAPDFDDVSIAQPLLYLVNYALGRVVLSWGLPIRVLFGHSVGELVAATLAGVMSFQDGQVLMQDRVKSFQDAGKGGMAAVATTLDNVRPVLNQDVHLAAINAPRQIMLAGTRAGLTEALATLNDAGITGVMIAARQAFHSPLVSDAVARTMSSWRAVGFQAPAMPLISAYTGSILDVEQATDPNFWANQAAQPLDFHQALTLALGLGPRCLLEVGPGDTLLALARRAPQIRNGSCLALSLMTSPGDGPADGGGVERLRLIHDSVVAAMAGGESQ